MFNKKWIGNCWCDYDLTKVKPEIKAAKVEDEKKLPEIEIILKRILKKANAVFLKETDSGSMYSENVWSIKRGNLKIRIGFCDRRFEIYVNKIESTDCWIRGFNLCKYTDWITMEHLEDKLMSFFALFPKPKKTVKKRAE